MNVREFAALKVGDKIENPMLGNSKGTVSEVTSAGVRIAWEGGRSAVTFLYSLQSTSWMHWAMAEDSLDAALDDFTNNPPKSIIKEEP